MFYAHRSNRWSYVLYKYFTRKPAFGNILFHLKIERLKSYCKSYDIPYNTYGKENSIKQNKRFSRVQNSSFFSRKIFFGILLFYRKGRYLADTASCKPHTSMLEKSGTYLFLACNFIRMRTYEKPKPKATLYIIALIRKIFAACIKVYKIHLQ